MFAPRDFLRILSSTALSNGFLIILSLLLAKTLPSGAYADFAFAVSTFALCSLLFDFGLNYTALRKMGDADSQDIAVSFASVKLVFLILVASLLGVVSATVAKNLFTEPVWVGVLAAASNNVWLAVRTSDQGSGDTRRYFVANVSVFFIRISLVAITFVSSLSSLHFLYALYVYPMLLMALQERKLFLIARHVRQFLSEIGSILGYSKWVFASSALFVATIQLPVLFFRAEGDVLAVATLGAAMTVGALSSWLSASLKPFFIGRYVKNGEQQGDGKRYALLLLGTLVALAPAGVGCYLVFDWLFGAQYKEVPNVATTVLVYSCILFILSLYNSQIHAVGRPELEAALNLLRFGLVFSVLWFTQLNITHTLVAIAFVMVGIELALSLTVRYLIKRRK